MATIEDILGGGMTVTEQLAALRDKTILVPSWAGINGLITEYEPDLHPVMNKALYPDVPRDDGTIDYVTRVTLNFQKLAVKRMTELVTGIPVRRIYSPENERQQEIAKYMERIFQKNRIDSVNNERCSMLFAACEVMTLWYAVEERNNLYGFDSPLKLRCRNFTPMLGDTLFPLFDEYGDLVALSVGYKRKRGRRTASFFDAYTADRHIKWTDSGTRQWSVMEDDPIELGKIPAIYMWRPMPIWESTSKMVYEMEWSLSRNGNYLRKNSKPLFVVMADEQIRYGDEKNENEEFRAIMQYPKGSTAQYVTWAQAVDTLKYHIETLRNLFFTQLQLPDWSYEKMSQQALSGESRKQMFIDAQLKVKDESGRLIEFFSREVNVIKSFMKAMMGDSYANDIDALGVEIEITPFTITEEKDTIDNLLAANGNLPLISQRESIEMLNWSADVDKTLEEIQAQQMRDVFEPTM